MNSSLLCPSPLVSVPFGTAGEGSILYVDPDDCDCAIPCPQLIYSDSEWSSFKDSLFTGSLVSMIAALFVLTTHCGSKRRYFLRLMFIAGFFLNSMVVLAFSAMNHKRDEVVCGPDGAEFMQRAPLCVFQGAATIWAFTWIEYWSVVLSFDSYMMVSHRATSFRQGGHFGERNDNKMNWYYTFGAFAVCTIFTSIPLGAHNFGFDPMQNIPLCLFIFSSESSYFWSCFIVPLVIMVSLCCFFSILGMIQMHTIFVNSNHHYTKKWRVGMDVGGGRGRRRSEGSTLTDEEEYESGIDEMNFVGVRDSINPLSDEGADEEPHPRDSVTISTHNSPSHRPSSSTEETQRASTSTPLLSSSFMSGSRNSEATSINSELNTLLGGKLALDVDEVRGVAAPPAADDASNDTYDSYFNYNHKNNDNNTSNTTQVSPIRGERGSSSSPSRAARGSDSTRGGASAMSATTIYKSVASFWTRSAEKRQRGGDPSSIDDYGDDEENDGDGDGDGDGDKCERAPTAYTGLTSQHLALRSGARQGQGHEDGYEDGEEGEYSSQREHSKETISLGTGPNQSRDDSGGGPDTGSTNRKKDAANARVSMLRNIVKGKVIRQTLRYNGRGLLFVFVYCLSTLYIVPVLYVLQAVTYDECQDSAADFASCLLSASYVSIDEGIPQTQEAVNVFAEQQCGAFPAKRPNAGLVYSGLIWLSAYGIIPALIFGVGTSLADTLASWACCASWWLRKPHSKSLSGSSFSSEGS